MFVNNDIRKEMYKGPEQQSNTDTQFKKLYIYHMENVSILFADIKVRHLKLKCKSSNYDLFIPRDSRNWLAQPRPRNWSKY